MEQCGQCNVPAPPLGLRYVQMAPGNGHSALLLSDATVIAFGWNYSGQCDVPPLPPGVTYVGVSSGTAHSLAVRSEGIVVAWGDNLFGQCNVPTLPPGLKYVAVNAAFDHSAARLSDGSAVMWGWNGAGQCDIPPVPNGSSYVELSLGGVFGLARMDPTTSIEPQVGANGRANLTVLDIRYDYALHPDQTCSVKVYALVQNTGTSGASGFLVGLKSNRPDWVPPLIQTGTGKWTGLGGPQYLAPGQVRVVTIYGPGYVGPAIPKGTQMQLTAHADMYGAVKELRENDNELTKTVTIGG